MKELFVAYAKSDPPGLKIDKLDYTLYCFRELKSADEVAWWLIKKLPLSAEIRMKLATALTADQAKFLANWLSSPDRKRETKPANVTSPELFAAVLEAPDDDAPRLAYADWLEEHGNPLGEFIRAQCELAKSTGKNLAAHEAGTQLLRKNTDVTGKRRSSSSDRFPGLIADSPYPATCSSNRSSRERGSSRCHRYRI